MMAKGLKIAEPPRRRSETINEPQKIVKTKPKPEISRESEEMFTHIPEAVKVQFNKRVKRGVADGYEMLAIRTRKKVPELLEEALTLLEKKYGRV